MKNFLKIFLKLIVLPALFIIALVIYWDPFKIYFSYDDYYTNNVITGNREDICYKLYNKSAQKKSNFIIGNSRSHAFKTNYWSKKISQKPTTCFHYDGSGMGLYRATNAIIYLDNQTEKIDNILLVIDPTFLNEIENPSDHLFIQHPCVSNESKIAYYWTFIKSSIDVKFILYNIIYKITGEYYNFMGLYISSSKNFHTSNNSTGDIYYAYDKDIAKDSVKYYQNLLSKREFYNRNKSLRVSAPILKNKQIQMLSEIRQVVNSNKCQIKIVVSPLYDQLKLNINDKRILVRMFGEKNVFDYSGINDLTSDYTNFYESSHYKPYIANTIINEIYN